MPQPYLSRIFIFFKIKAILKFVLLLGLPCLASVREDAPNPARALLSQGRRMQWV